MKTYIIDALNVIHKSKTLRNHLKISKENAVSALCSEISAYLKKYPYYKFFLVIDGVLTTINKFHRNIFLFESQSNTADDKIKEIIKNTQKKSDLLIISSDTEVYNFSRMNAVDVITSEIFLKEISNDVTLNNNPSVKSNKLEKLKPNNSSKKELIELKNLFSNKLDEFDPENYF